MPGRRTTSTTSARHANHHPPERTRLLRGVGHGLLVEALAVAGILGLAWIGNRI
jgi:hypothetical protein